MISPLALIRCRGTRPKRRGGPAHASAAPEPPASTSVGLLGSTRVTVAMPQGDWLHRALTVRVMGRRLLVSRKIGVGAAAAASLAGHAHNHDRLGVSVGRTRTWTRSGDTL